MALKRRLRKIILLMVIVAVTVSFCTAKKSKSSVISDVNDAKDFKKLLKARSNILVLFVNQFKLSQLAIDIVSDTAEAVKGQATISIIDCNNSQQKKLCKKFKVLSDKPFYIKHFRNGDYHKDYDRSLSATSMTNFLRDPTGDLPWEEDPAAVEIFHLLNGEELNKFLKKTAATHKRSMIMFYAPWCGYCKILKPDYLAAASELKGEALLAAIDVAKPGNTKIRMQYNITGFPTILYFEKGVLQFPYNGDNTKQAIIDFLRDPAPSAKPKKQPEDESWPDNSDVVHLTADNFEAILANVQHALVIFYAPWCGHCKRIKPELEKAAAYIKTEKIKGIIAAVDATNQPILASKFGVKAYPTLKYFNNGVYKFDAGHVRQEKQIIEFMKDPQEPPPPPPPEEPWSEQESAVRHLDASNFRQILRRMKYALVMFYAPWCGHCKTMKPEFIKAAEAFSDELIVALCAVDCTSEKELCGKYDVKGFPTIKYFSFFDRTVEDYSGGRKAEDFVKYIHSKSGSELPTSFNVQQKTKQQSSFGAEVTISTDRDFENLIAKPKPTFVMFFASWCAPCTATKPEYTKLAVILKKENSPISTIAIDASINPKAADLAQITNLPIFKLYMAGKMIATYEGERTADGLLKFCKKYEKVKDEL